MKTIEYEHQGSTLGRWFDELMNALARHVEDMKTWAICWDKEGWYNPGTKSLYYQGIFFLRLCWPFGWWLHIRVHPEWQRFQTGFGFKINGRFGANLRLQSDKEAEEGVSGPNWGQAKGWDRGTA